MEILKDARDKIDALDERIVALLAERFRVVHEVGLIKAREGIAVVQAERAAQVRERVAALAEGQGLDGNLLRAIYTLVIEHAHTLENRVDGAGGDA